MESRSATDYFIIKETQNAGHTEHTMKTPYRALKN